jgi:hypothetical protein
MKIKLIISLLLFSILFSSCERQLLQDDPEFFTLSGRLVQSCENTDGVAGVQLSLFLDENNIKGTGKRIAEAITDEDGNFTLTYEGGIEANIYLETFPSTNQSPRRLMMGIPLNQSLNLGLIFDERQRVDITLIARTDFNFSSQDTLKLGHAAAVLGDDGKFTHRKIIGPFSDGQVLAVLEDSPGTVQTFLELNAESSRLTDPDFVPHIGYFFQVKTPKSIRYSPYLTTPCTNQALEIVLDSAMLGK